MSPLIYALGGALGGALILRLVEAAEKSAHRRPPGMLTPQRIAIHGELMANCNDPKKLKRGDGHSRDDAWRTFDSRALSCR